LRASPVISGAEDDKGKRYSIGPMTAGNCETINSWTSGGDPTPGMTTSLSAKDNAVVSRDVESTRYLAKHC
jgi:hypothetical protein